MKLRIAIQKVKGKQYKHIHNIMLETKKPQETIKKIRKTLQKEINQREEKLIQWIQTRKKTFIKEIIEEIPEDLIDWKSKGKDINKEEYLENEIWFEVNM